MWRVAALLILVMASMSLTSPSAAEDRLTVSGTVQDGMNVYEIALCTTPCINEPAGADEPDIGFATDGSDLVEGVDYFSATVNDLAWSVEVPSGTYRIAVGYAYPTTDAVETVVYVRSPQQPYTTSSFEEARAVDVEQTVDLGEILVRDVEVADPRRIQARVDETKLRISFEGDIVRFALRPRYSPQVRISTVVRTCGDVVGRGEWRGRADGATRVSRTIRLDSRMRYGGRFVYVHTLTLPNHDRRTIRDRSVELPPNFSCKPSTTPYVP